MLVLRRGNRLFLRPAESCSQFDGVSVKEDVREVSVCLGERKGDERSGSPVSATGTPPLMDFQRRGKSYPASTFVYS